MIDTTIYIDCDGVLLNWNEMFQYFVEQKGFVLKDPTSYRIETRFGTQRNIAFNLIEKFTQTKEYSNLKPMHDAVECVRILEKRGYKLHVITASLNFNNKRNENLKKVFGSNVFSDIEYTGFGGDKRQLLETYRNKNLTQYWVEDKPSNALLGAGIGYKTFLQTQPYNKGQDYVNVVRINSLKDFVNYCP